MTGPNDPSHSTQRQRALTLLNDWDAPSPEQEQLRRLYLGLLNSETTALARHCHPDHVTASALVVTNDRRQVALTLHPKIGKWLQTGGHIEASDEDIASAALREAQEETGITELEIDHAPLVLSRHEVPCGPLRPAHHLDIQFLALAPPGSRLTISQESVDLRWFDVDDLPPETDQSVRDLVTAAIGRLRGNHSHDLAADNGLPTTKTAGCDCFQ